MLARYEWLERRYGDRPEYARRMLPLRAGFAMERALDRLLGRGRRDVRAVPRVYGRLESRRTMRG